MQHARLTECDTAEHLGHGTAYQIWNRSKILDVAPPGVTAGRSKAQVPKRKRKVMTGHARKQIRDLNNMCIRGDHGIFVHEP